MSYSHGSCLIGMSCSYSLTNTTKTHYFNHVCNCLRHTRPQQHREAKLSKTKLALFPHRLEFKKLRIQYLENLRDYVTVFTLQDTVSEEKLSPQGKRLLNIIVIFFANLFCQDLSCD